MKNMNARRINQINIIIMRQIISVLLFASVISSTMAQNATVVDNNSGPGRISMA